MRLKGRPFNIYGVSMFFHEPKVFFDTKQKYFLYEISVNFIQWMIRLFNFCIFQVKILSIKFGDIGGGHLPPTLWKVVGWG